MVIGRVNKWEFFHVFLRKSHMFPLFFFQNEISSHTHTHFLLLSSKWQDINARETIFISIHEWVRMYQHISIFINNWQPFSFSPRNSLSYHLFIVMPQNKKKDRNSIITLHLSSHLYKMRCFICSTSMQYNHFYCNNNNTYTHTFPFFFFFFVATRKIIKLHKCLVRKCVFYYYLYYSREKC